MLQIQCKMSRDATSVSNPLETEVTSNYIRATPGFNRGCVSNVGKILSARLYCICTKTCTSNWHLRPYGTQYTDELHSLSYIRNILGT